MRGSSKLQRGRAVESRSSTVRRRQSATGVGCGHHTLRGSAVSGCRPECGCGPAPVSTRRGPQPGGLAVCCANRCRGRGRHHRRSTGSGMGPAVDRNRSRRGSLGYHRYCGYADSPARSHTPSCGAAARATSPCADGATTGTTAPGGAACAAVPGGARPGGRAGQTSAAVAERSRRHRGPRRAVATWPSLCLGRNGANQFDCSGLVQWAYAQAGVHLDRTTYQQINEGIPVPRSQVRPGDLVFPHPGHVQLAIGNNLVVEAPHAGASVRVSSLGNNVQIRRPLSGR